MSKRARHVGIIADQHAPFTHPGYLDFCKETFHHFGVTDVVHIGDVVDHHAISYHEHDPDGLSAGAELKLAKKQLALWYKAFPKVKACIGNHDALIMRKALSAGLPKDFVKTLAEIYEAPAGWEFGWEWDFGNWQAKHGTGGSGSDCAYKLAVAARQSTVCGHIHTAGGVRFHAAKRDLIFGMNVGCGVDMKAYAFAYGKDFKDKPVLGCGVVLEDGRLPLFLPMV